MIKHIIMVKWQKDIERPLLEDIKTIFDKLLKIDGIHKVEYHENVIGKPNRFDVMICIIMEKAVLPIYDESAPHHEWKEKYGKFVENKAIFDFEE